MPSKPVPSFDKKMLDKLKSQAISSIKVVVLNGYIGETTPIYLEENHELVIKDGAPVVADYLVRIYPVLNHNAHFTVRLSAIEESEPAISGLTTGPLRLLVDASSVIEFVQQLKTDDSFLGGNITASYLAGSVRVKLNPQEAGPPLTVNGDLTCPPFC